MILVAVVRVSGFPDPIKGSMIVKCTRCEEDCWASPGTQHLHLLDRADVEVVCEHCIGTVVGQRVVLVRDSLVRSLSGET